jgi:hypothetical protein
LTAVYKGFVVRAEIMKYKSFSDMPNVRKMRTGILPKID